jgi:transposase
MISVTAATRVFVALEPVDMRQSFNGLYARVQSVLQEEPTSGHLFVFTNRHRHQTTFRIPFRHGCNCLPMASPERAEITCNTSQGTPRH